MIQYCSGGGRLKRATAIVLVIVSAAVMSSAQSAPNENFVPFQQWMGAVLAGDAGALKSLYSANPPAEVRVKTLMHDVDTDTSFWIGLKVRSMKVDIISGTAPRPDTMHLILHITMGVGSDARPFSVTDDQVWQKQGGGWRLVAVERTDDPELKQPADMTKNIYPPDADAHAEIKEAEEKAAKEHKRLLLVFGANWCFDCHVLDLAFRGSALSPMIEANYELVHVDIGPDGKKNADVAKEFDASLDKGVPVIAVAEPDGKVVVSEKNGEFEDARQLTPQFLWEFLNKWKPEKAD